MRITLSKALIHTRLWFYEKGFRPKAGSILYSPSLHLIFACKDARIGDAFAEGMRRGRFIK